MVRNGRRTILFLSRSFFRWFDGSLGRWCEIMTPIDYRLVWWRMSPILVHIHHGACQAWPRALTPLTPNSAGRKTNHHHWSGEKRSPTVSKKFFTTSITAASRLVYYHDALQQVACSSAFIPFMNGTSLLGTTSGRSLTRSLLILEFNRRNCDFIFQTGLFPCHQFSLLGVPNRKLVTIINQWPNNLLAKQKVKKNFLQSSIL